MIIKELVLHNFGIYASTNKLEFHGEKPVVLIGGMNGRGKTTLLEGILLALYGNNSFAYRESSHHSYGQYLKSFVNRIDGTLRTYIELEFLMKDEDATYRIRREWDGNKRRLTESISVFKDGKPNQFLTDHWLMFMENLLPSGLSEFFFFDGEKIAKLAEEKTSKQMQESIKALMGVSVLDSLENDLYRVINKTAKSRLDDNEIEEIENLRQIKEEAIKKLELVDVRIDDLYLEKEMLIQRMEKLQQDYQKRGGDVVAQQQELFQKRSSVAARMVNIQEQLVNDAASELPLVLVRKLLENIKENAEIAQDEKLMETALKKMDSLIADFDQNGTHSQDIQKFMDFVKRRAKKKQGAPSYNLSDTAIFRLQVLLEEQLLCNKLSVQNRQEGLLKLQKEAEQLDSYLSVEIDEKAVARIYKRIKEAEQKYIALEVNIESMNEERRICNGDVIAATALYSKKVEGYLKRVELNEDRDRIIKYSHMAVTILNEYKIRLQHRKIKLVAETMTKCYKKLANKKNMIQRIEMDPDSLDLKYMNQLGEEVAKSSLSAGEKQLMVVSLLWALALCSKKKLPVIIDTPLSRLDSAHREALINIYFPQASEQTIILSTDSEIDRSCYESMKDNIGDEYTLEYNDETKTTTVKKGYFTEALK